MPIELMPGAATHAARITNKAGPHHCAPAPKPNTCRRSKLHGAAACRTTSCCSRPTSPALARWVCLTCVRTAAPNGFKQCCHVCSPSPLIEGPCRSQCVEVAALAALPCCAQPLLGSCPCPHDVSLLLLSAGNMLYSIPPAPPDLSSAKKPAQHSGSGAVHWRRPPVMSVVRVCSLPLPDLGLPGQRRLAI